MKFDGVRRSVQAGDALRKPGSAPSLGRVVKIPAIGRPVGRHRRQSGDKRREKRNRARQIIVLGWSIAIAVITVVALGVAFSLWLLPRLQRAKDTTESDRVADDAKVRVISKFKSPSKEEALALVKKALALRTPEGVEDLIRTGPLTAAEVVDYLKAMKSVDGEIADYAWLSSIDKNGLLLEGVQVSFAGRDKPRSRLAILTPDLKGVWKMDFEAFARWVKPSWETIVDQKAETALIRVYVTKDNYFNGPFKDDRKWAAYKMASPDMDEMFVGYCMVDSAQHRALELMWARGEIEVTRATLEIKRVEGADRWQFEITRVLAEDWVMAEKPLDEGLQ
jgi:hypothetical protein